MGEKKGIHKKEDAASPTVSLGCIMINSAIEVHKGKYVATIDILVSYIHTDSDEEVIMILKVMPSELLVNIDPKIYRKYAVIEKGVKILYVRLKILINIVAQCTNILSTIGNRLEK